MAAGILVVAFVTSFLVWMPVSGGAESNEETPGIIVNEEGKIEEGEVVAESVAEEETDNLSKTISNEEIENSDQTKSAEEPITVVDAEGGGDDVVMITDTVLEPLTELPLATPVDETTATDEQATPPGDETLLTDQQATPPSSETEEYKEPEELFEATPTEGEVREGGGEEGEEGDDVPTFTEFSQRKRMEQNSTQRVTNDKPAVTNGGQHNYASLDCGAKIIASNKEAQNPSAILSENRDHYMINPCSAEIWFVVELCELVELHSIQIACFELFSSIPENFNISVSERYPVDEWRFLGMLHASNEREVQTFLLSPEESSYAKFLRVDMVSHYGSEHFCPLSLLRVNGSSMMEVYEYSETLQEGQVESLSPTVGPYDGGKEEDDLLVGALEDNVSLGLDTGLPGAALKEYLAGVVRSLIETVGDFMRPSEENESTPPQIITLEYPTPESEVESESAVPSQTSPNTASEEGSTATDDVIITTQTETEEISTEDVPSDYHTSPDGLVKSTENSKEEKTHFITSSATVEPASEATPLISEAPPTPTPATSSGHPDNGNKRTEETNEVIQSGTTSPDNSGTSVNNDATLSVAGDEDSVHNGGTLFHNATLAPEDGLHHNLDTMVEELDNTGGESPPSGVDNGTMVDSYNSEDKEDKEINTVTDDPGLEGENLNATTEEEERNNSLVSVGEMCGGKEENDNSEESGVLVSDDEDFSSSESAVGGSGEEGEGVRGEKGAEGEGVRGEKGAEEEGVRGEKGAEEEGVRGEKGAEEEGVRGEKGAEGEGVRGEKGAEGEGVRGEKGAEGGEMANKDTLLTNGNGAAGLPGQPKEKSVFLRLSNRIRDLEENMSLFSSYLDQISTGMKRNKNRTEDGQKSLEKRLSCLNDSLQLATNQTEQLAVVLVHLLMEEFRETVQRSSQDMEQSIRNFVWLVSALVLLLTSLLAISIATILWLLCNKTTKSHDRHVTRTGAKDKMKRDNDLPSSKAHPLTNGVHTVTHIGNGSGLPGATESQQTLELHSDESLNSEPWNRVARKRKKRPKMPLADF